MKTETASLQKNQINNMRTFLITGDTYLIRKQIKAIGGRWIYDEKGWAIPVENEDKADELVKEHNLNIEDYTAEDDIFEPLEGERKRKYLQERRNRKADRLEERAEKRQSKASDLKKQTDPYTTDWSFVTQPILTDHHSAKSFRSLKERINGKVNQQHELLNEAEDLSDQAERLRSRVRIKGDAQKERNAKLEANRAKIKVGDEVENWIIQGQHKITKINKRTYRAEGVSFPLSIEFIK